MKHHICQITTVHRRKDGRIFYKECLSLVEAGYRVTLIVNDGLDDEQDQNVQLIDLGGYTGRVKRIVFAQPKALLTAWRLKADIYHYHDPELFGIGLILSLFGKKVIYDVHEDLPNDIMFKPWIRPRLQRYIARISAYLEGVLARRLAACVCTTQTILDRFKSAGGRDVVLLRNYPVIEGSKQPVPCNDDCSDRIGALRLCYAGGISDSRGLRQMIELAGATQTRFCLMGPLRGVTIEELEVMPGWQYVDYLGMLTKEEVEFEYCRQPAIGLVILLPGYGYDEALPIKLFEYMQFGLPVLCSNFPLWQSIVSDDECGIAVDPEDMPALCAAVQELKEDPDRFKAMAVRGKQAVREKYSWAAERTKLLDLYKSLL
ncbi:glycosyltransferase family 4 protein [Granulosicoccus sp. 3-233]|uniref:glycosyltransferase family 4 protein n=1 Tax=Granulosicoccus sp. 3-233 TaxID=3417969 RepID=UPI003D332405